MEDADQRRGDGQRMRLDGGLDRNWPRVFSDQRGPAQPDPRRSESYVKLRDIAADHQFEQLSQLAAADARGLEQRISHAAVSSRGGMTPKGPDRARDDHTTRNR